MGFVSFTVSVVFRLFFSFGRGAGVAHRTGTALVFWTGAMCGGSSVKDDARASST
jgi:hypothetical protein